MSSLFTLQNNPIIDLYEIKINDFEGYFSFHGSKNLQKDIVFQGRTYLYIPCELSNLDYTSDQKQNRPTVKISNVNNFITNLIKDRDDLLMKKFYRKKIFAKDLDLQNFENLNNPIGNENFFTSFLSVDTFIIQKKNFETRNEVEFVLSNIIDIEGQTCPSRKVYNDSCQWIYRGFGCSYGKRNINKFITTYSSQYNSLNDIITDAGVGVLENSNILAYFAADSNLTVAGKIKENVLYIYNQDSDLGADIKISKEFDKVNSWSYQHWNGSTLTTSPLTLTPGAQIVNAGRTYGGGLKKIIKNNNTGVLLKAYGHKNYGFTSPDRVQIPVNIFSSNSNQDLTIICVYEFSNILMQGFVNAEQPGWWPDAWPKGGQQYSVLQSANNQNTIGEHPPLGKGNGTIGITLGNKPQFIQDDPTIKNKVGQKRMLSFLNRLSGNFSLFKDAQSLIINQPNQSGTSFSQTQFGFNLIDATSSEIILYEVMIFNKVLDEKTLNQIYSYLSHKYNISIPINYKTETKISASDIFPDGYNLGIPMADENNKIFLRNQDSKFQFYENYNLDSLTYRGDYDKTKVYKKGDIVKIDPQIDFDFNEEFVNKNYDSPSSFFVCVDPENGQSIGQHPYSFTKIWREDKCSKTLNGCRLRFDNVLPFGGFPGTVPYEYKFPGGS